MSCYNRQTHVNYIVGMLIAEIPPENFVEEARRVYADAGEILESHIRLYEADQREEKGDPCRRGETTAAGQTLS